MTKRNLALGCLILLAACSGPSVPGTYSLDKAAMKATMTKKLEEGGGGTKETAEAMAKVFDSMEVVVKLNADGTCSMDAAMPMGVGASGGKSTATGTYKVEGDQITINVLEEKGKKKDKPDSKTGTIKGGVITLSEMGIEMRLVKK